MNYFNKKKVVIWVIVVLLAVNIASIGTIVYRTYYKPDPHQKFRKENRESFRKFWEGLNLTEEQSKIYRESYIEYRQNTKEVYKEIHAVDKMILDEFAKPTVDPEILKTLGAKFGNLHKKLKELSIQHVMKIKTISTPEQYEKMDKVYRKWLDWDKSRGGKKWYRNGKNRRNGKDSTKYQKE